jgi:hypothetical protein
MGFKASEGVLLVCKVHQANNQHDRQHTRSWGLLSSQNIRDYVLSSQSGCWVFQRSEPWPDT